MFGIVFDDHPDLSRILMPETGLAIRCARTLPWVGFPCSSRAPRTSELKENH